MIETSEYYSARPPANSPKHCADCGVRIMSGRRCAMHSRAHNERLYWRSNSNSRSLKCTPPGWLEEIFARDLSHGMTVNEISKHRGVPVGKIIRTLENLHQWLLTQPVDMVNTFAGLALTRVIEDSDCRVA